LEVNQFGRPSRLDELHTALSFSAFQDGPPHPSHGEIELEGEELGGEIDHLRAGHADAAALHAPPPGSTPLSSLLVAGRTEEFGAVAAEA
jgi:hypothetical protein